MRARTLALTLALAMTALAFMPASQASFCNPAPGATVCVGTGQGYNEPVGVFVLGDQGHYLEASATQGTGFAGDFLVVIAIAEVPGLVRAHAGAGFSDYDFDGMYEQGCVCGAVQSFVFVPFGVGFEDNDGDNVPDNVFILPEL